MPPKISLSEKRNRLKEIRLLLGLQQSQFSELLGVKTRTISRWENEDNPKIDIRSLRPLYDIGFNPLYIVYEDQALFRPEFSIESVWKNLENIF